MIMVLDKGKRDRDAGFGTLFFLLVIVMVTSLVPRSGTAEVSPYLLDTGPLRIRDQFFLGMGFLAFDPVSADVLQVGEWQIDLIETATNNFARSGAVGDVLEKRDRREALTLDQLRSIDPAAGDSGIYFVDGELYRTAVALRRGIGKGVQLEVVVPVLSFGGGVVDSLVEGFHRAFGFGQAGRLGVPKDSFLVYARSREGELFIDRDPGLILGDLVLGAKFRLRDSADRRLRLALETLVKLPTGGAEPLGTSGSADFGTQLLLTRYYSKACLHGSLGFLALGASDQFGLDSQTIGSGMIAYERGLGPSMSALIQVTVSHTPFRDLELSDLDRTSRQVTLGFKKVIKRQVFFVGLTENFGAFNNTPDIGLHVGITRSFVN